VVTVAENDNAAPDCGLDYLPQVLMPICQIQEQFAYGCPGGPAFIEENTPEGQPESGASGLTGQQARNPPGEQIGSGALDLQAFT
jgi:hypothetical protein